MCKGDEFGPQFVAGTRSQKASQAAPPSSVEETVNEQHLPTLTFYNSLDLEEHMLLPSSRSKGFWLKISKTNTPLATIGKQEAIDAALCCGWIDGQLQKLDEHHYAVRMTPRRVSSLWSARNRENAERLLVEGRMRPSGLSQIEAAKSDGRWQNAYVSQRYAEPPEDLLDALSLSAAADHFYRALSRADRYSIIYRVSTAKKPETRTKLIGRFVEMLARGEALHCKPNVFHKAGR